MFSKLSKKTMFLIGGILIVVLTAGGSGGYLLVKNNHHKSLVNEYNRDFSAIQEARAVFKTKLDAPPADVKTLQDMITFYKDLQSKNTFLSQFKELNTNSKYQSLQAVEKKEPEVLDLERATTQLADKLKDIEKLQSILQRSTNLDTEISEFAKHMNDSDIDYDYFKKIDDLSKRNNVLKDELLSLVVSDRFKEVQSSFVQALNGRGNAVDELKKTFNSLDGYHWALKSFDSYLEALHMNLEEAQQVPDIQFSSFITRAYDQVRLSLRDRTNMDNNWNEATKHKAEYDKLIASYSGLIGLPLADTTKLTLKQEVRASSSDLRATVFIQDYLRKGMMALAKKNFYIVQPYLDKDGKSYWEQYNYMDYLQSKGISENLLSVDVKSVEPIDTKYIKVTTSEKYYLTYGDGTHKIKTFTSVYKLTKGSADTYMVNELMTNKEEESIDK